MQKTLVESRIAEKKLSLKIISESNGEITHAQIGFQGIAPRTNIPKKLDEIAKAYGEEILDLVKTIAYVIHGTSEDKETEFKKALLKQLDPKRLESMSPERPRTGYEWPEAQHVFEHAGVEYELKIRPRYGMAEFKRRE